MQLDEITAELRPRTSEEAIDLGLAMTRVNYARIMGLWATLALPICFGILLLTFKVPLLGLLAIVWLKPIFDRIPLLVLSQGMFGGGDSFKGHWKTAAKLMVSFLFRDLVASRLSLSRSLHLPVSQLEGLKGTEAKKRHNLLSRKSGGAASILNLQTETFVLVLTFGCMFFVSGLMPGLHGLEWQSALDLFFSTGEFAIPAGMQWTLALSYLAAFSVLEPFYVGAGFALYLNTRTLAEGWDIEVNFKRISKRLKNMGRRGLGLFLAIFFAVQVSGQAADFHAPVTDLSVYDDSPVDKEASQAGASEVLASPDFEVKTKTVEYKESSAQSDSDSWHGYFLGVIFQIVFWVLVAAALVFVVYQIVVWLKNRSTSGGAGLRKKPVASHVMGMSVAPETLPGNLPETALEWWLSGRHVEAVSLLYRGAISWLIHHRDLEIRESDTEGDCLSRVNSVGASAHPDFFDQLTQARVKVSYAKELPTDDEMRSFCSSWPFHPERKGAAK